MSATNDGAESVDAFLERIASLKDRRHDEDQGSRRRLEDEILQGRSERQARRAERAKSLSPVKRPQFHAAPAAAAAASSSSPPSTASQYRELSPKYASNSPVTVSPSHELPSRFETSPRIRTAKPTAQDTTLRSMPSSPSKSSPLSNHAATGLSRSGTLSWQQRPSSRDSNASRGSPFARPTNPTPSAAPANLFETRIRDQTTVLRSSNDPFRSPGIVGQGAILAAQSQSKSTEQYQPDIDQKARPLPEIPREPDRGRDRIQSPPLSKIKTEVRSPVQPVLAGDRNSWNDPVSGMSNQSTLGEGRSPFPSHQSQKLPQPVEALASDRDVSQPVVVSTVQGGSLRDRSTSPTKGLGGFVQSAMMKRSDSVNKRWSAKAGPGLSRGNSMVGFRGSRPESVSAMPAPESPPRESSNSAQGPSSSPLAASRPTSTHSTSNVRQPAESPTRKSLPRPSATSPTRQVGSVAEKIGPRSPDEPSLAPHPVSPTKTMDPKRWSPTKASWLESALSKPEVAKIASSTPQTPSWMIELEKQKLPSDDVKSVRSSTSSYSIKSPIGLVRSPPLNGLARGSTSSPVRRHSPEKSRDTVAQRPESPVLAATEEPLPVSSETHAIRRKSPEAGLEARATDMGSPSPGTPQEWKKDVVSPKPKSDSLPTTDFRANLRSRQARSDELSLAEPEFKNVFGKLKRTETKKYVAPDRLKDNILRGKAALNLTDGPQKTKRVDEFRESILKKKEAMKAGADGSDRMAADDKQSAAESPSLIDLPEALAKRNAMSKDKVFGNTPQTVARPGTTISLPTTDFSPAASAMLSSSDSALPIRDESRSFAATTKGSHDGQASRLTGQALQGRGERPPPNAKKFDPVAFGNRSVRAFPSPTRTSITPATGKVGEMGGKAPSTLADRLNSHLAGVVRGEVAPPANGKSMSSVNASGWQPGRTQPSRREPESSPAADLTHMTKARAKGPKRRLPQSAS